MCLISFVNYKIKKTGNKMNSAVDEYIRCNFIKKSSS